MNMTLEQVRDDLRRYGDQYAAGGSRQSAFNAWADAIEAHLAKAGKPVAYRISDGEGSWFYTTEPSEFDLKWSKQQGTKYEPLYAAPPSAEPAQPVEHKD